MNRRNVFLSILITAVTLCGCGARYAVTGMERSRVLIDKRYDAANDAELQAFIAPYKQRVDLWHPLWVVPAATCRLEGPKAPCLTS